MKENIIETKSVEFASGIIRFCQDLANEKKEFVLSRQLLRSGTAIGGLIREAKHAESKADFLHKMSIALKEANETACGLLLLKETGYINENRFSQLNDNCVEVIRLLVSIVKSVKTNLGK